MPSKIELLVEAEKRGILPPEKKPLLDEARKRGLAPPLTPQLDAKGNNIVAGPPNEPGLIDEGPPGLAVPLAMAGSFNDAAKGLGSKLMDVSGPLGIAAKPAGAAAHIAGSILPENFGQVALMAGLGGPLGKELGAGAKYVGEKLNVPEIAAGAKVLGNQFLKPPVQAVGNMLADVIGELAGKDPESVKTLFNNPKAMWQKASEIFGRKHQEQTLGAIEQDFAKKKAQFGEIEDAIAGNFGTPSYGKAPEVLVRPTYDKVRFQMAKERFRMPEAIAEGLPIPLESKIPQDTPEYKLLIEKMAKLKDNPRMSFADALTLKQNLDKAIDYGIEGSNGMQPISEDANRLLVTMRKELNSGIRSTLNKDQLPIWDKVNAEYGTAASSRAELRKQVMGSSARLTEKKLHQLLKEGRYDDEVLDRARDLGAAATKRLEDVRDHIAARQFKSMAGGKSGWGAGAGATAGAFLGGAPGAGIGSGVGALVTSPKSLGYGVSAAGAGADATAALARSLSNSPMVVHGLISHALARDAKAQEKSGITPRTP